MKRIKQSIESSYDSLSPKKIVFTDKKRFYRKELPFTLLWILLAIPYTFIFQLRDYHFLCSAYMLVWFSVGILGFYSVINPYAKKQITKLGVVPSKGWFNHWANENFMEYKLKMFYQILIDRKILNKNLGDIQLLDTFSVLFDKEASNILNRKSFSIGGSVIFVFVASFWSQFLDVLFKFTSDDAIMDTLKLCLSFLFMIIASIVVYSYFQLMISDYLKKKGNKYKEIQRFLSDIKMNLMIQNNRGEYSERIDTIQLWRNESIGNTENSLFQKT